MASATALIEAWHRPIYIGGYVSRLDPEVRKGATNGVDDLNQFGVGLLESVG